MIICLNLSKHIFQLLTKLLRPKPPTFMEIFKKAFVCFSITCMEHTFLSIHSTLYSLVPSVWIIYVFRYTMWEVLHTLAIMLEIYIIFVELFLQILNFQGGKFSDGAKKLNWRFWDIQNGLRARNRAFETVNLMKFIMLVFTALILPHDHLM